MLSVCGDSVCRGMREHEECFNFEEPIESFVEIVVRGLERFCGGIERISHVDELCECLVHGSAGVARSGANAGF